MLAYLLQGFLLGLAYVAPIGTQNLYVINSALSKTKWNAYKTALITIFFDISLALACFFGIGLLLKKVPSLEVVLLFLGSVAVIYIGVNLVRAKPSIDRVTQQNSSLLQTIGICFSVTWLNPQAIIDGTLLLGGLRASLPNNTAYLFIVGVAAASFTWFITLTTLISIFRTKINMKILRYINILCGSIIIYYGIKLAYAVFQLIK